MAGAAGARFCLQHLARGAQRGGVVKRQRGNARQEIIGAGDELR